MSAERDDLIAIAKEEATDNGVYMGILTAEYIADAILAAGYRKRRTITTVEELDALPVWSVVANLDTGHVALKTWESKHPRRGGGPLSEWKVTGDDSEQGTYDIALPATALYEGVQS